ncbi:Uncharacterized protein K02A2.6, partial [Cyphomyrmex costatus]
YTSTPNPNVPNQVSPAEALLGRLMRTTLDLLKPSECSAAQPEKPLPKQRQEEQYNRRHAVKSKSFEPGTKVYVQIHTYNKWSWIPEEVVEKVGKVIYNVLVETRSHLVRAHANQIKLRAITDNDDSSQQQELQLPLEILVNAFDDGGNSTSPPILKGTGQEQLQPQEATGTQDPGTLTQESQGLDQQTEPVQQPVLRRSQRNRRRPRRLEDYYCYSSR